MFRVRPLTWLFAIATLCVDLVMVVPMFRSSSIASGDLPHMIFMFGVPAQLSLVAIWGAIGKSHRLARGAMGTLAIFLATASGWLFPFPWHDLLTFYLVHTLLVFCGALILRALGWLRRWPSLLGRKNERFRYPVIEMFGWTIVVAIWAFAWRHATVPDNFSGLFLVNFTAIPLITIALVCRTDRWWLQTFLTLVACLIATASAGLTAGRFGSDAGTYLLWGNLVQVAYLSIWYAVQHFDLSMRSSCTSLENDSSMPLKLYQE